MNSDFIYWTFSAASQSVAAFIAFLITGYMLVHTMMENAQAKDDTLEEVHKKLLEIYHKHLTWLACLTGLGIVLSLVVVYANRPNCPTTPWLVAPTALVDLAAVVLGIVFVIRMVDPRKYQKAAVKVLEEDPSVPSPENEEAPVALFFDAFVHLERLIREYLQQRNLYVPSRGAPRMSYSFRQMIEALLQNEKIDRAFYIDLLELNKYRNLVFHGHRAQVDPLMVSRAKASAERIAGLE